MAILQAILRLMVAPVLAGKPPLLDQTASTTEEAQVARQENDALEQLSNRALLKDVIDNVTLLAKKELELAKSELRRDLKAEVSMAKGLGVASICALCTLNLLLVAAAFALAHGVADWAAPLIVAAAVLAVGTIAGTVGWKKRVTSPLESTRRSLKEDARWAKERLA